MSKENKDFFDFENLKVYQKSLDLIDVVYKITEAFPAKETYNITSQFRRSCSSIALNIGEGSGGSRKEFIQFLVIANRSLRECVVCTSISHRRKYISEETQIELRSQLAEIAKMLTGLRIYLESDRARNIMSEPLSKYISEMNGSKAEEHSTNYELRTLNFNSELPTNNG